MVEQVVGFDKEREGQASGWHCHVPFEREHSSPFQGSRGVMDGAWINQGTHKGRANELDELTSSSQAWTQDARAKPHGTGWHRPSNTPSALYSLPNQKQPNAKRPFFSKPQTNYISLHCTPVQVLTNPQGPYRLMTIFLSNHNMQCPENPVVLSFFSVRAGSGTCTTFSLRGALGCDHAGSTAARVGTRPGTQALTSRLCRFTGPPQLNDAWLLLHRLAVMSRNHHHQFGFLRVWECTRHTLYARFAPRFKYRGVVFLPTYRAKNVVHRTAIPAFSHHVTHCPTPPFSDCRSWPAVRPWQVCSWIRARSHTRPLASHTAWPTSSLSKQTTVPAHCRPCWFPA